MNAKTTVLDKYQLWYNGTNSVFTRIRSNIWNWGFNKAIETVELSYIGKIIVSNGQYALIESKTRDLALINMTESDLPDDFLAKHEINSVTLYSIEYPFESIWQQLANRKLSHYRIDCQIDGRRWRGAIGKKEVRTTLLTNRLIN